MTAVLKPADRPEPESSVPPESPAAAWEPIPAVAAGLALLREVGEMRRSAAQYQKTKRAR